MKSVLILIALLTSACSSVLYNEQDSVRRITGKGGQFTPQVQLPDAPSNFNPSTGSSGVATSISLTCVSANATSFIFTGPDTNNPPTTPVSTPQSTCIKAFEGLTAGTVYYWKVAASNTAGTTTSSVLSFTTASASAPTGPSNVSPATGATSIPTSVTITWACNNALTYDLYGPDLANPPTTHNLTASGTASYNATGLTNSTVYYIKPTCTNASGTVGTTVYSFTVVAPGVRSVLQASNIEYIGSKRVVGHGFAYTIGSTYARFGVSYVGGERRFLISQDNNNGHVAPAEFADNAVFDEDGDCTSNCPSTAELSLSTPALIPRGNWGFNKTITANYDFFHGIIGKCWGTTDCNNNGPNAFNDCSFNGGSNCDLTAYYLEDSTPRKLHFTYTQGYGSGYHKWSTGFCTLDVMPELNVTDPASTCYGPFAWESLGTQTPNVAGNSAYQYTGTKACNFFLKLPDGGMACTGWGSAGSYAGAFGSSGPYLYKLLDSLPGTSTDTAYTAATLKATAARYLTYYSMACNDITQANCGGRQHNFDGSMPAGRAIWAFRHYNYQAVYDGIPCAINADNPVGMPAGCGAPTNYVYTYENMTIDPRKNNGISTWNNLDDTIGGVFYQDDNLEGFLSFVTFSTNHRAGNTTACQVVINGVTVDVAHTSYCNGQYKGISGNTCSGDSDGGFGHPGDVLSPEFQCLYKQIATGPSDTYREPAIIIFSVADLNAVAAGTKVDYTVDPVVRYYPLDDNPQMKFAAFGTNGVARAWGQVQQDPNNKHIIFATAPQADNGVSTFGETNIVMHYFRVR